MSTSRRLDTPIRQILEQGWMLESIRVRRRQCKAPPLLEELSKFLSRDGAPCIPIGVDAAPLRKVRRQELSKFLSGNGCSE